MKSTPCENKKVLPPKVIFQSWLLLTSMLLCFNMVLKPGQKLLLGVCILIYISIVCEYQFCSCSEGFQSKMTSNMSCIAHSNECIESPVSWLEQQLHKSQMAPKHDLRVSKSNGFVSTQEIIRGTRDLAPFGKIHLFVRPKLLEHPTPNRGRNPHNRCNAAPAKPIQLRTELQHP